MSIRYRNIFCFFLNTYCNSGNTCCIMCIVMEVEEMISLDLFRERLKQTRESKGLSVEKLGELTGTSGASISRWETGIHEPKSNAISLMAEALGVNPAWLMGADVDQYDVSKADRKIPVLGYIAAGRPILAQEQIVGHEHSIDCDFCLQVKGDSMINARIYDGDIVFIHAQEDIEHGEIAAVLIGDDEATLKRVYKTNNTIILHSENPMYQDMVYTKKDMKQIKILGKAKYFKSTIR